MTASALLFRNLKFFTVCCLLVPQSFHFQVQVVLSSYRLSCPPELHLCQTGELIPTPAPVQGTAGTKVEGDLQPASSFPP